MQRRDKIFLGSLGVAVVLLIGITIENIRSISLPPPITHRIDVARVKAAITQAGIIPHAAGYWKSIENK